MLLFHDILFQAGRVGRLGSLFKVLIIKSCLRLKLSSLDLIFLENPIQRYFHRQNSMLFLWLFLSQTDVKGTANRIAPIDKKSQEYQFYCVFWLKQTVVI